MQKKIFTLGNVRIVMLYLALFIFGANAYAQETRSLPMSFFLNLRQEIQKVNLPDVDKQRLLDEDRLNIKLMEAIPYRFGVVQSVNLGLDNSGTWETLTDGSRIWRLTISSEGAYCVYPIFNNFYLPEGATLHAYTPDRKSVRGAFNSVNNSDSKVFAISLLPGKSITLEYYEPRNVRGQGKFTVESLIHSYRDILNPDSPEELACNININCPVGIPWSTEKRGVARITFTASGGSFLCSGSLINNTANDRKRYFLTANHCESNNNAATVFDFNYEASNCSGTSSPQINTVVGSTLRANNPDSDTRLLEINPVIPANFNVYYNGWNRGAAGPTTEAAIHHPGGAIKKYSFCSNPAANSNGFGTTIANSCWQISWTTGYTEGGSSGCPMFDQNHRIIGQNYGGTTAVCGNPGVKYFGKFWMSWDRAGLGGVPSNELKDWLDAGNLAPMTLDGIEAVSGVAPTANFTSDSTVLSMGGGQVNFYDISINTPTTWSWSFPGGTPSSSTAQFPPPVSYSATGNYTVSLTATNAFGPNTVTKTNYIQVRGVTMNSYNLIAPSNLSTIVTSGNSSTPVTFSWNPSNPSPTVTYKLKLKKAVAGSLDNIYVSDNNGVNTFKTFRTSFLDSLALQFGTTAGDSVTCTWRAWAYNGVDSAGSVETYVVRFRRDPVGITQISTVVPEQFALYSNYPNPFNPSTIIKFDIAKTSDTKLRVFDMLGKEVSLLVNKTLTAGQYAVDFNAASIPSGVYFYRLETPDFVVTKRMMLVK
ncbi:hypothetical protein BH10BAC5_BH10BAC5_10940 [soil metagenome]